MEFLFNKKKFKRKYTIKDITNFNKLTPKIFNTPILLENYFNFFNDYAKKNYLLKDKECICKNEIDLILAESDRHMVEFQTVICKNCGLVRAKKYFLDENVSDFYANHYRKICGSDENLDPEYLFNSQYVGKKNRFDLIKIHSQKKLKNLKIVDLGGGAGGILDHFKGNNNQLFLVDYYEPYLEYAKKKEINVIKGGLKDINFKPDIIIMSHVIEHWSNFDQEIQNLIKIQEKNETLNYIEFPGIDSLKLGRREANFIGDIHVPHVYYFHSKVFENIMNRYGFEKVYIDSRIWAIFRYTGQKYDLRNFYSEVKVDLEIAERLRYKFIIQNFIKLFLPNTLIKFIRYLKKRFK